MTSIKVNQGFQWKYACIIHNIPDWSSALQIEWKWKHICRTKYKHIKNTIDKRLHALIYLLSLDRATTSALPYEKFECGLPYIIWQSDELRERYNLLYSSSDRKTLECLGSDM